MQMFKSVALALFFGIAALGLSTPSATKAAILLVGGGQLTGATGVVVAGVGTFDVTFVDGTCIALFDGCDAASDFDFQTASDAIAAAGALLDQVFLDVQAGQFDTQPELTFGCSELSNCFTIIPFAPPEAGDPDVAAARNVLGTSIDTAVFAELLALNLELGPSFLNFALFSDATAVPEPASLILFGVGLLGLAGIRRRRQRR